MLYGLPYWQIKKIQISGERAFANETLRTATLNQMQARWLWFFKQNKLWTFDTKAFARRLKEKWIFSELKISKRMPDTIILKVTEERPAFVLKTNSETLVGINNFGIASNLIPAESAKEFIPLEFETWPPDLALGKEVLFKNDILALKDFVNALNQRKENRISPQSILIKTSPDRTAIIKLAGERELKIDRSANIQKQINAFFLAYDQKLSSKNFEYIDVTVPDRVYYK